MTNLKKKEYFNVITGEKNDGKTYGKDAKIFKYADNISLIYDSRGKYLGLRISKGKFEFEDDIANKGLFIWEKGPFYFKSSDELKIWEGVSCIHHDDIKIGSEGFVKIKKGDIIR